MIYVLHGADEFSRREFLNSLSQEIGPSESLEANTNVLAGVGLTARHIQEVCQTVPFLAEKRLVIVDGLLGQFDDVRAGRRGRPFSARTALEGWEGLAEALAQIPPTTTLVFAEGALRRDNPLLKELAPVVQIREFPLLTGEKLGQWIRHCVEEAGATITQDAVGRLVGLVGGNLWAMSGEIEKLALYVGEKAIDEEAVGLLVEHTREESIFRAVDTILDGRSSEAMRLVGWLRQSGAEVSYVITMLARQLRLILLAQEFLPQRLPRQELGQRLGLTFDRAVRQTEAQARRHAPQRVVAMYRQLLETDLAIKKGEWNEELALETLVAELCQGSNARSRS